MGDAEPVLSSIDSTTSIVEQLGKTFLELKSHEDSSEGRVQWKELEEYFHNLERLLRKNFDGLEEKEKAFETKDTEARLVIQEREANVSAKEQLMLDRVQELKEAAVSSIEEAREKYKLEFPDPAPVDGNVENKVSTLLNGDPDATIPDSDEKSPHRSGEPAMAVDVQPRPELTQFCEQMDAKGLLNFIMENRKDINSIREEIPVALKNVTEPTRLVLDSLEGFYPPDQITDQCDKTNAALQGMRKSCVMLMESVAPLLVGAETDADHPLTPETKQQAKAIADEWKPRLVEADTDFANGNSLEAEAFLQLLATFRIASEFDEDELCKLVLAITRRRQAPELCRSLGLTDKMPGVIETLINMGKQTDAVHFVQAFKLSENFPPVPLLKTYLKDLRRNSQGKGANAGPAGAQDVNTQELNALRAVIKCVEEYKLQAEYPLDPLQKRVSQLEKAKTDKKRTGDMVKHQQPKKARANGGYYGHRMPLAGVDRQPPVVYSEVGAYIGASERYPQVGAATYDYQGPSQGLYGQHDIAQRSHYYPPDERAPAPSYGNAPSSYGAAAPYGGAPSTYGGATSYGAAPSNYGSYIGSGLPSSHPSHQSYI
ncbi:Frigida-like protein [Thalictrum thalictroides]|uniref:FRIGIDA-like protein n=1 Tax=Thalictrum thalictroides TaxID=46969 RepID=A0A7J6VW42_THATH|nr:Frigida-like protein [Thalictrum thalictroides]